ncbi:hypothetical protein KJ781_04325 [Patescibacteria group bacterium]|nr:hypothetical protein [Patescibacteria group bacterium]MBU2551794.1 hypothetical protein [Pseudomonadota bacterium]
MDPNEVWETAIRDIPEFSALIEPRQARSEEIK